MKKEIGKYLTILPVFTLLVACASTDPLTSAQGIGAHHAIQKNDSNLDYVSLSKQYENLANEMKANARKQENTVTKKLRARGFSKNGWHHKSRAALKSRRYEKAAQENFALATYYKNIAVEQAARNITEKLNPMHEQIDKAKKKIDGSKDSL